MTIGKIIDVVAALEIQLFLKYVYFYKILELTFLFIKLNVDYIDKKAVTDIMPKSTHLGLEPTSMHALRAIFLWSPLKKLKFKI